MKRIFSILSVAGIAASLAGPGLLAADAQTAPNQAKQKEYRIERSIPKEGVACIECHKKESPGIFVDWAHSRHASANITCIDCHKAEEFDPDVSKEHYKQYERSDLKYGTQEFKVPVTAVVTPKDCSRCHPDEAKQYARSKHANTLEIIWKVDPWLNKGMNSDNEQENRFTNTPIILMRLATPPSPLRWSQRPSKGRTLPLFPKKIPVRLSASGDFSFTFSSLNYTFQIPCLYALSGAWQTHLPADPLYVLVRWREREISNVWPWSGIGVWSVTSHFAIVAFASTRTKRLTRVDNFI